MGYLSCWNLSEFWKITTDAVKVGDADRDVLPNHERQLEVIKVFVEISVSMV